MKKNKLKQFIGKILVKIAVKLNICIAVNVISDGRIKPLDIGFPALAENCTAIGFDYLTYAHGCRGIGK